MRKNELKARLRRGEPAIGVSIMIPSPQIVEMVGRIGFDWVLLDCEHGTISIESLETMTMAAEASGITAVARPGSIDPGDLLEVLERGVAGVQVPHVGSAAQARQVVEAVKYHPQGKRGLAARTRPAAYGLGVSLDEYTRAANDETLVCIQLESASALREIDEMLDVDGVDVFFLGPSDLSQSLGHPGSTDHAEVREAMRQAFATITSRGRIAGSAGTAASCRTYREQGATYLYTHLPGLLEAGAAEFLEIFNPERPSGTTRSVEVPI